MSRHRSQIGVVYARQPSGGRALEGKLIPKPRDCPYGSRSGSSSAYAGQRLGTFLDIDLLDKAGLVCAQQNAVGPLIRKRNRRSPAPFPLRGPRSQNHGC